MHKERIAISGVNGFVGHHLAQALHSEGMYIIGIGTDLNLSKNLNGIVDEYYAQDLIEQWPDTGSVKAVIHLAGLAAVGPSFENPQKYINSNSTMVTNLCEYYLGHEYSPRIVLVSSGAIYSSDQPMPITERSEVGFNSPYAVSKILNENQAAYYRSRGLNCIVARPFNHIGPGQKTGFILPDFYERISMTKESTISVGNIATRRDYTDVRDIVKAYSLLSLAPALDDVVYNICSGHSLAGTDILNKLKSVMNRTDITFEIDPALVRPTDIPEIVGDSSRLQNELGWQPHYTIDETIRDFVEQKLSN